MLRFANDVKYIHIPHARKVRALLEKGEGGLGVYLVYLNAPSEPGGNIFEIVRADAWGPPRSGKRGVVVCVCASRDDARGFLLDAIRRFVAGGGDLALMHEVLYEEACGGEFSGAL